jgi:hypothetical protein
VQGTGEIEGDISNDGHAPPRGSAEHQSAGQLRLRRTTNPAQMFRSENTGPGPQNLAARVDQISARVAERAARGGGLTATERGALLELIAAIAALLEEDC